MVTTDVDGDHSRDGPSLSALTRHRASRGIEILRNRHWTHDMKSITSCATLLFRGAPR